MKKILALALVSCFILSTSALAQEYGRNQTITVVEVNAKDVRYKVEQIMEDLIVINNNEINAAKVALKRSSNASVKHFARVIIEDHSQNLNKTRSLADALNLTPMASERSNMLKKLGKNEVQKLNSVPSRKFNRTYLEAMINGHEKVLNIIDELLSVASNPRVIEHLKATREKVAAHLRLARQTLNKL